MNEIRTLTSLELRSLYDINKMRFSTDKKERTQTLLANFARIFVFLLLGGYTGLQSGLLVYLGLGEQVLTYLAVIASLLVLAFGIFRVGHNLFAQGGYELLLSMPFRSSSIVISRFLLLYIEDLLFTYIIILPGIVVYGVMAKPEAYFYFLAILLSLLLPMIPLVISVLIGTAVMAITSRMKHKNIFQTFLLLALTVVVILWSFRTPQAGEISDAQVMDFADQVAKILNKLYPPAAWFTKATLRFDLLSFFLYVGSSLGIAALMFVLVSKSFDKIMQRLFVIHTKKQYKLSSLGRKSLWKTLLVKEGKRYFSSSIYVVNTIVGPLMGTLLAVALCLFGQEKVNQFFPQVLSINQVLPFGFSLIFCMMTTTSTSISLEGKHLWQILSLPITTKEYFDAKILLNLCVMAPFYLISEIFLLIAMKPSGWDILWLVLVPVCLLLFSAVIGITTNIKWHSFDWLKEEQVVKQSVSALLGGFAGAILALGCIGILLVVPTAYKNLVNALLLVLILGITFLLYRSNNKKKLTSL